MEKYISDFFSVLADNIKATFIGDYECGKTDLNTLGDIALTRLDHVSVTPKDETLPALSPVQRKLMREFYKPYVMLLSEKYHSLYTSRTGKFSPRYLPEDLYATVVDRYFSDREEARYLDNKCYYYRLFSNVKQPELVAMRIGSTWYDGDLCPIPEKTAAELVKNENEVVVKRAVNSEGGYGVDFIGGKKLYSDFMSFFHDIPCDVVVQRPVRQHPQLAELHENSVNTLRIVSLLTDDHVKVYKVCVKIGSGDSRIDNGCHGGMYCGVMPDGSLRDYAVLDNGKVLHRHPDLGYAFSEKKIPHLGRAVKLVKEAHSFMGHFRLVSWDIAIDDKGEAVLIEANLTLGGINNVQMCSGPLFGRDTKKILDEAFKGRKKVTSFL